MAGSAFRTSARSTTGAVVSSANYDRQVTVWQEGPAVQRIGFVEADVGADAGFRIPPNDVVQFILEADDTLYLGGVVDNINEGTRVYFLITKAV